MNNLCLSVKNSKRMIKTSYFNLCSLNQGIFQLVCRVHFCPGLVFYGEYKLLFFELLEL